MHWEYFNKYWKFSSKNKLAYLYIAKFEQISKYSSETTLAYRYVLYMYFSRYCMYHVQKKYYNTYLFKPLVCRLFGPHAHAHHTKIVMCSARTRTPFFVPAHASAPTHFLKKISKKNFFSIFFFNFFNHFSLCFCK